MALVPIDGSRILTFDETAKKLHIGENSIGGADLGAIGFGAESIVIHDNILTTQNLQDAFQAVIDTGANKFHVFNICSDITIGGANNPTGVIEGNILIKSCQPTKSVNFKITFTNGFGVNFKNSHIVFNTVDISQTGSSISSFIKSQNAVGRFSLFNLDLNINGRYLCEAVFDGTLIVEMSNVTGVNSNATQALFLANQNASSVEFSRILMTVKNGTDFSGLLVECNSTKTLCEITAGGDCVLSDNGNGVYNLATGSSLTVRQGITAQVSRNEKGGTSIGVFNVIGKANDLSFFLSDQDSALTVSTPITFTSTKKRRLITGEVPSVTVKTAPTGSTATFDILVNSVSVFTTVISIDAGEKTSVTSATPAVLDATKTLINIGDLVEIKILSVGSTVAGTGAKINIPNLIEG